MNTINGCASYNLRKGFFVFEKYLFTIPLLIIFTLPAVIDKRQFMGIEFFFIGTTILIITILLIVDLFSKITYTYSDNELLIKWGIKIFSLPMNDIVSYRTLSMMDLFKLQSKAWFFRFPIIIPYIGVICRYKRILGLSNVNVVMLLLSWGNYIEIKNSDGNIYVIPYHSDTVIILDTLLS